MTTENGNVAKEDDFGCVVGTMLCLKNINFKEQQCACMCVETVEHSLETISRGWDSVGRRLAGATMSLPALDVDDEAQPLHQGRSSSTSSHSSAAGGSDPNGSCTWNTDNRSLYSSSAIGHYLAFKLFSFCCNLVGYGQFIFLFIHLNHF